MYPVSRFSRHVGFHVPSCPRPTSDMKMYPGKDISKSGYEIWPSPSHGMRADPSIITLIKDERKAETGTGTRQVTRNSLIGTCR